MLVAARAHVRGFSDATMSLAGAAGIAVAGPVMGLIGYPGLGAASAALLVAAAVALLRLADAHR